MYLEELSPYKIKIMKNLCTCEDIQKLILASVSSKNGREMMYKNIFPYSFVPDTVTKASTFICFDMDIRRVQNRTFKDINIIFWIFSHQSLLRTVDGIRTDLLSDAVDKLINGSRGFGLGTVELQTVTLLNPAKDYHGRTLVYRSVDFNRVV